VFEHDVWDEEKNTLVDPSLLEDKKESDEGEFGFTDDEWNGFPEEIQDQLTTKVFKKEGLDDEEPYMPDVYGIDPYPHRHEFIDNVCVICNYVLKSSESKATESLETWWNKNDREFALNEIGADISLIDTEWYNLPDKVRGDIMDTFRNAYGMGSTNDYKITTSLESKASEYNPLELDIIQKYEGSPIQVKNNMAENMGFKNWKEMIGKLKMRKKLDENGDTFEELSDAERNAWLNIFGLDPNTSSLYESKATEGGRGSGRKGHQKWMLGAEADPEECPHCMIFTEKKNGNCQICGNSY